MFKSKKYLKIIFLNLSIFSLFVISLLLVLETVLRLKATIRNLRGGERTIPGVKYCNDADIKPYAYCSKITHTTNVSREKLDYKIVNVYVDKS